MQLQYCKAINHGPWRCMRRVSHPSVVDLLFPLRSLLALRPIRLEVKVREENEHEEVLNEAAEQDERGKRTIFVEQGQAEMEDEDEELNLQRKSIKSRSPSPSTKNTHQLHLGDVLLPPQRRFQLRLEGGQEVVSIHDDMHQGVDKSQQRDVASAHELGREVRAKDHSRVMVYVEEGDLPVLLPQHEKDRVQEIKDLEREIKVGDVDELSFRVRVLVVQQLTAQGEVFLSVRVLEALWKQQPPKH